MAQASSLRLHLNFFNMIKIGVSPCFIYQDINRAVFGPKTLTYIENDMARYLTRKGVIPVLIPELPDAALREFLGEFDGFVFQGGDDIAPESYGETPIGRWKGNKHRDDYELKIMDFAIKNDKPVFAICRGMQLLNVYFGGKLYQDIATQTQTSIVHRDAEKYDSITHEIVFTGNDFLENLYGEHTKRVINSIHHQGIKDLGNELEILAKSTEDGMVEAIMWKGTAAGKVLGVQWHPEFAYSLKGTMLDAELLYDNFLQFCT